MNKRRLIKASLWTTALSPFFFASCVDDSYDLTKDIDMTITVGGDLSIPGSGTGRIHVGRNYGFGRQQRSKNRCTR